MNYSLNSGLLLAAQFLQVGILVTLFKRGWHRRYPWFTAYIVLEAVSDPFLTFASNRFPYTYYFGYWATVIAAMVLTVAVLYEVIQHVWRPFDAWRKLGAALVWLIVALITGQSAIALWTSVAHSFWLDSITSLILLADRDVRIVACGVGLFILFFRKRLGVSWRELVVGIVAGFVLFSAVHLVVATAMAHQIILHRRTLSALNSAGYILAELIWLGYAILSPKFIVGGSTGSTPPGGSWPGGWGYTSRAMCPWWSRLKLRGFLSDTGPSTHPPRQLGVVAQNDKGVLSG